MPPVRRLPLPLLLLFLIGSPASTTQEARAEAPETWSTPSSEADQEPAIQVQKHETFITVYRSRARGSMTWTVSVLDPVRANGAPAPPELEGATSQGATVKFGELRVPESLAPGTVLQFKHPLELDSGPYPPSGRFATVAGLPIERAELVVKASGTPLSVWTDPLGQAEWGSRRFDELRVVWRDLPADASAQAVWSSSDDWLSAGQTLRQQVEQRLTTNIGRNFTRELAGFTASSATEAVFNAIKLVPGPDVGWSGRPATRILAEGSGTQAERGLVLISVLRAAGFEPIPGLYRPTSLEGGVPTSIAVPSMLQRPVVAVPMGDHMIWIDPGADWVQAPALPSGLSGATAWLPDDLPRQVIPQGPSDGSVTISGEVRPEPSGTATFNVVIGATGAAQEYLREQLSNLDETSRQAWFRDFATQAHSDVTRLNLTVTGVRAGDRPLSITARGQLGAQVQPITSDLTTMGARSLLAPSLALALPPRIAIREELSIPPPGGRRLLTVARAPTTTDPSAIISQQARREGDRLVLLTEIERPERHLTASSAARAETALSTATQAGPALFYLREATPAAARRLRSTELPAAERVTLESMILWRAGRDGPARRLLKRFVDPIGIQPLYDRMSFFDAPGDLRRELIQFASTEAQALETVPILVELGQPAEAWAQAAKAAATQIHHVRASARLAMVELQPASPPDPQQDPEGAERWRDPLELLQEAAASADRASSTHPELTTLVLAARGRLLLSKGQTEVAEAQLEQASASSRDPNVAIDLARAQVANGAPLEVVYQGLRAAIERASADPTVYGRVADVLEELGAHAPAARHARTAARLAATDVESWLRASRLTLLDGDLVGALGAVHRASDLQHTHKGAATELVRLAVLARRPDLATLGLGRGGTTPGFGVDTPIMELLGELPEGEMLAVLRHHDDEVTFDPGLLSLRGQLELVSGDRDRAVRDGTLLTARHGIARGGLIAFGASAGAVWSTGSTRALDALVSRDPAARNARVETRALIGERIDIDLRQMRDDPRGRIWQLALSDPESLAAQAEGWSPGLAPLDDAPRGYSPNPILGSSKGVAAWSSVLTGQAVVRHTGNQTLPPPLSLLYTLDSPALRALPSEGRLYGLSGGSVPLYAAIRIDDGEHIIGLGHTAEAAARALKAVPTR